MKDGSFKANIRPDVVERAKGTEDLENLRRFTGKTLGTLVKMIFTLKTLAEQENPDHAAGIKLTGQMVEFIKTSAGIFSAGMVDEVINELRTLDEADGIVEGAFRSHMTGNA